jgi:hypothetical protein
MQYLSLRVSKGFLIVTAPLHVVFWWKDVVDVPNFPTPVKP